MSKRTGHHHWAKQASEYMKENGCSWEEARATVLQRRKGPNTCPESTKEACDAKPECVYTQGDEVRAHCRSMPGMFNKLVISDARKKRSSKRQSSVPQKQEPGVPQKQEPGVSQKQEPRVPQKAEPSVRVRFTGPTAIAKRIVELTKPENIQEAIAIYKKSGDDEPIKLEIKSNDTLKEFEIEVVQANTGDSTLEDRIEAAELSYLARVSNKITENIVTRYVVYESDGYVATVKELTAAFFGSTMKASMTNDHVGMLEGAIERLHKELRGGHGNMKLENIRYSETDEKIKFDNTTIAPELGWRKADYQTLLQSAYQKFNDKKFSPEDVLKVAGIYEVATNIFKFGGPDFKLKAIKEELSEVVQSSS